MYVCITVAMPSFRHTVAVLVGEFFSCVCMHVGGADARIL